MILGMFGPLYKFWSLSQQVPQVSAFYNFGPCDKTIKPNGPNFIISTKQTNPPIIQSKQTNLAHLFYYPGPIQKPTQAHPVKYWPRSNTTPPLTFPTLPHSLKPKPPSNTTTTCPTTWPPAVYLISTASHNFQSAFNALEPSHAIPNCQNPFFPPKSNLKGGDSFDKTNGPDVVGNTQKLKWMPKSPYKEAKEAEEKSISLVLVNCNRR